MPKCDFNSCFSCCFSKDQFQPDWNLQHFNIVSIYVNTCYTKYVNNCFHILKSSRFNVFSKLRLFWKAPKVPREKAPFLFPWELWETFQGKFIEITLRHGCSPVNMLHIFRTPFPKNTWTVASQRTNFNQAETFSISTWFPYT